MHSLPDSRKALELLLSDGLPRLPPSHPARVAVRTGILSLGLALVPSLVPLIVSAKARKQFSLKDLGARELGAKGFPFAILVAFGGSAWLEWIFERRLREYSEAGKQDVIAKLRKLKTRVATGLAAFVAISLLQKHRRSKGSIAAVPLTFPLDPASAKVSPSLDFTIIIVVRAIDALVQCCIHSYYPGTTKAIAKKREAMSEGCDALVFSLASWRIMWCWFFNPFRLPKSYVRWIGALARLDKRLIEALQGLRAGTWRYGDPESSGRHLLSEYATELGYPSQWGDPGMLPATGGPSADVIWKKLKVHGRDGIGGLPSKRWSSSFLKACLIYTPVHLLPKLLHQPTHLLQNPLHLVGSVLRSSTFLATFVASIWWTVCFIRTWGVARLFPQIPHRILDGHAVVFIGTAMAGPSIFIEKGKRRGEIALYVLPRAIRTLLSERWLRSGSKLLVWSERFVFVAALTTLVDIFKRNPLYLRGLSRLALTWIYEGWPGLQSKKKKDRVNGNGRLKAVDDADDVRVE